MPDEELICARQGCGNEAEYYPQILLYSSRKSLSKGMAAKAIIKLPLCGQCMVQTRPRDLLTEEWWQLMNEKFALSNAPRPRRNLTKINWVGINEFPGEGS